MSDLVTRSAAISRQDVRDDNERRIRELALELDLIGDFNPYQYVPPGPVARAFLNSGALTSVLMGPLGGGKTTTCVFKRIMCAAKAPIARHPEDGKPTRMCRGIILRDTFRAVEKTVLESWKQWFPKNYPGTYIYQGGNDRPLSHGMRFMGQDGIRVELLTEFAGLGEQSIESMMKGREYSFGWLNELDTHVEGALDDLEQRLGRYPSADLILQPREIEALEQQLRRKLYQPEDRMKMALGDMNAPTIDNWTYETLVTNCGPDRKFFQQPSGLSTDPDAPAENKLNLDKGYYERIVANQDERFVERMVHNKFGYSRAGKAVHPTFDHRRHVAAQEIEFNPNLELHIGVDVSIAGLSPAAMFGQATTRIKLIDELYVDHGVGPARFAQALKTMMNERYPNLPRSMIRLWPDPASEFGGDKEAGELDAKQIIEQALGVVSRIPGTGSNALGLRLAVVDKELRGYMEPNSSLLISPRCKLYIGAIAGKYRFKKKPAGSTNDYEDMPEKAHPWSDVQDAGQYLILGVRGPQAARDLLGELEKKGQAAQQWSTQGGEKKQGWKSQGGFDPHKAGM